MFEKKKICVKFGFVYAREPRSVNREAITQMPHQFRL